MRIDGGKILPAEDDARLRRSLLLRARVARIPTKC
jgi:hypothetical protein